jgi:glycosyltransferase involved in cell wall biosynthesis
MKREKELSSMKIIKEQSILFIKPDYHYSFTYCEELSKRGWDAHIYVPSHYPENLLSYNEYILKTPSVLGYFTNKYIETLWLIRQSIKYKNIVFYGKIHTFSSKSLSSKLSKKRRFILELAILKMLKKNLIYLPSGCHDEFTKEEFFQFDYGNVCSNCGFFDRCNDEINKINFDVVKKYFTTSINLGFYKTPHYESSVIKYKCIEVPDKIFLDKVPREYQLLKNNNIKIFHSTALETRQTNSKNIKGSNHIKEAVSRLRDEGYSCEYVHLSGIPASKMKYYQAQSDIYVDQLIYGMWGSTAIEAMSLGKAVICYLRPEWKENFLNNFGYTDIPIIEATTASIYSTLKKLLEDTSLIEKFGEASKNFAMKHYDIQDNVDEFINLIKKLNQN